MNIITAIYKELMQAYGPQGWWPINGEYHKGNYNFPQNTRQQFEIICGSILTQNTSWIGVTKAIENLRKLDCLEPNHLLKLNELLLKEAIKPAGYFNQKAEYLKNISRFFLFLDGKVPAKDELLEVKGVGEETADSILLYAYKKREFVVDAYTRRIFTALGIIEKKESYADVKKYFEVNVQKNVNVYQEYHALIVEHAKRYYQKKPYGEDDFLIAKFKKKQD